MRMSSMSRALICVEPCHDGVVWSWTVQMLAFISVRPFGSGIQHLHCRYYGCCI